MPFSWVFPVELSGFVSPQSIRFTLTPFLSGSRITCNLLAKEEYFFHFRVDFHNQQDKASEDAVVRGSTKNLIWQKEERAISRFPFSKGITCDILFIAYGSTVAVDVDGVPFVTFKYRDGDDPKFIDRVTVNGDCVLHRFTHTV
ncbi:galactoside-binding lectin [Dictyocaulus viviparus]|uniref:Galectin n=1 Tax=Dictyocaulus viviparus TaxID=29172 RepID=A0A0D8XR55_DICVI|nr:galactoside-binding lectin [Dictyocaulus viviparus]